MRRYLGWEPAEVTSYEYDDEGRVVRAVTVREPEFSAWDRALFLHQWQVEQEPRGKHGLTLAEATDPANRGKFVVEEPTQDFAAEALVAAQKAYEAAADRPPMEALLWRVSKVD